MDLKDKRELLNKMKCKTPWSDPGTSANDKKIEIEKHFKAIMEVLGMDLTDDSLIETPKRVAKMYVDEVFQGLMPDNFPKITCVENKMQYDQLVTEINITLNSNCEHHFVPIIGVAHISYIPKSKVIGLSKMNRIAQYFGRRPQIQERLTEQIRECMSILLETDDVAVVIDGVHTCVKTRGVMDNSSITRTSKLSGVFLSDAKARQEFFNTIPKPNEARIV